MSIECNLLTFKKLLKQEGYSDSSIHIYAISLKALLTHFYPDPLIGVGNVRIDEKIESMMAENNLSISYLNVIRCSISKYILLVEEGNATHINFKKHKLVDKNCVIMGSEVIKNLFRITPSLKHRVVLMLAYGAGLRLSEIRLLKLQDINTKTFQVSINGKHPRIVPLSLLLQNELSHYLDISDPQVYLFEGYTPGMPMTERALQIMPRQAAELLGIRDKITLGMLRNSFGAHLLEQGINSMQVARLMGYNHNRSVIKLEYAARHKPILLPLDRMY